MDAGARRAMVDERRQPARASASSPAKVRSRQATPSSCSALTARRSPRGSPPSRPPRSPTSAGRRGRAPRPAGDASDCELRRVGGLPPYVFAAINELKLELRRAGEDVIDLGFGNPDLPSPERRGGEAARGGAQPAQPPLLVEPRHPESARGDLRPLRATVRRRARPGDAGADDDRREGGPRPPDVGARPARRRRGRAEPELPDPPVRAGLRRARSSSGSPMGPEEDCFGERRRGVRASRPRPRVLVLSFPHNPTTAMVDAGLHAARRRLRARAGAVVVHDFAYADIAFDGHVPPSILQARGRDRGRGRAVHADQVVLDGRLAGRLRRRQRGGRAGARPAEVVPRLRHVPADPDRRRSWR